MRREIRIVSLILILLAAVSCGKTEVANTTASKKVSYKGDNYKIGVILPVSGKYQLYGESTLHGIECAVGIFSPCDKTINAELIIINDTGVAADAIEAVNELATKHKVALIIGPMLSSSIEPAAKKAQEMQVPIISLSQIEGITNVGDYVFSTALTAELQVKEIVSWATDKKKFKKFAILYPVSPYGQAYKALFNTAVKNNGGRVVMSEGYGASTTDFTSLIMKHDQTYEALFIPDSYKAAGFISRVMASEGVEGIQLLGNNRWNNPKLAEQGAENIEGSVFVDGFFEKDDSRDVRKFVSTFDEAFGIKPTILEAQAFDAGRLATKALSETGGEHTTDVRTALAALTSVDGATGPVGFTPSREINKKLFLLTVSNGNILELAGAPQKPKVDKYGTPIENQPDSSHKY